MPTFGVVGLGYWGNIVLSELEKSKNPILFKHDIDSTDDPVPVDFLYIATPANVRLPVLNKYSKSTSNFIVAKPLCLSSSELTSILNFGRLHSKNIWCDHNFTYSQDSRYIGEILQSEYATTGSPGSLSIDINRFSNGHIKNDITIFEDLFIHEYAFVSFILSSLSINIHAFWQTVTVHHFSSPHRLSVLISNNLNGCIVDLTISIRWLNPFKHRSVNLEYGPQFFNITNLDSSTRLKQYSCAYQDGDISLTTRTQDPVTFTISNSLSDLFALDCSLLYQQFQDYGISYQSELYTSFFEFRNRLKPSDYLS